MAHARAQTASSICFMFGLKERPYPGHELKSFWCDSDYKNLDFLRFCILADISVLFIWPSSKFGNTCIAIHPYSDYF